MQGKSSKASDRKDPFQISCFYIGDAMCGIDINLVQEINKQLDFTVVPHAPEYVMGIMNLRGKIVTIIDLSKKLGFSFSRMGDETRIIIVESKDEFIGLLVDKVTDVVLADWEKVSSPPSNIKGLKGKYFQGVYKSRTKLVAILDIEEVLSSE
ncbi:CheW protein [Desulfonatronospira thiodismutans ASO3-1]|uniref:CheW protein n=1 Tax=Desulfonatronospira thiodismutans ASO3-1 TaxID=555779 RepID=D6SLQ0_9BACT|nr:MULTISPECIES: chemotaxis protein CheW [Desulfonatronospira]EFI35611.1 CheW protein [Desulfonatronospira thiodismutans ASO3-1]RQD78429.1 MAG: chemotaxis protein CheW [Desulfonatronospira sp. MSAO_Bac3]